MKKQTKIKLSIICGCLLLTTTSCVKTTISQDQFSISSNSATHLSHQINQWLSTDFEGDEITMFITDNPKEISFLSTSGSSLYLDMNDVFIVSYYYSSSTTIITSSSGSSSSTSSVCKTYGKITPRHVGNTYLHIHDSLFDTIIRVSVLGEYYTYTEPNLDFDDTYDSVRAKLSKTYPQYSYNTEDQYYQVEDSRCQFNLYVNYSNDGTVDNYVVDLFQGVASEELTGYINERYYKTNAYYTGLPVYIRVFNISTTPSISDATVVVVLDTTGHKVTYQNPMTYSNQ